MMLEIDDQHPDASAPLLPWLVRYFEEEGAAVVIATGADNSLRSLVPGTGARFEVAVEGLPNLLHEALHAVQVGALADDHGIDYGLIPFDVTVPAQRRLLWQELACAAVSCGYLEDPAAVDPWFAEQIEIQGIFFGFAAEDLTGLRSFIEATIAAYGGGARGGGDGRVHEARGAIAGGWRAGDVGRSAAALGLLGAVGALSGVFFWGVSR